MTTTLRHLMGNPAINRFMVNNELRMVSTDAAIFVFNQKVALKISEHYGCLDCDVINLVDAQWGWSLQAIIQEYVDRPTIDVCLVKARAVNATIDGLADDQVIELIASLIILEGALSGLLTGAFSEYQRAFQPLTGAQKKELASVLTLASRGTCQK